MGLLILPSSRSAFSVDTKTMPLPLIASSGQHFVDPTGNWKRFRGCNYSCISHTTKTAPQPSAFQTIHAWGLNLVRFPFNWSFLEPTPGNIDWSYVDEIEAAVQMAGEQSCYILIDNHQWKLSQCFNLSYGSGFPGWFVNDLLQGLTYTTQAEETTAQAQFWTTFWTNPVLTTAPYIGQSAWDVYADAYRAVVWRLRNYPQVIGWDILNEPHAGAVDPTTFNAAILPTFYEHVATRLRWSDTTTEGQHHILFVEGQDGDVKAAMTQPHITNMALSPHCYSDPTIWTNCAALSRLVHRGLDKGVAWNVPVLVGEFGANTGPVGGPGPAFAGFVSHIVSVNGQSWCWWDFGPRDGDTNMELATSTLVAKPAVAALQANIAVFSGTECS